MAGGVRDGRKLKAVIPGGSSVPVVPGEIMLSANMDYDSVASVGSMLGSGAIVVMDETTSMVSMLRRIARFYYAESCGQCTPCREGTGWMYRLLVRIENGEGRQEDLDLLVDVADHIEGRTICALGDAAALVNRARPAEQRSELNPVEACLAEIAFLDLHRLEPFADLVCWWRIELARGAVVAVAGGHFLATDQPVDVSHCRPPHQDC